MSSRGFLGVIVVLAAFPPARGALAFGPRTHEAVTRAAAAQMSGATVAPCSGRSGLADFFRQLHSTLSTASVPAQRSEFLKRWPDPGAFGAFEVKGLLDLTRNPKFQVEGFDRLTCDDRTDAVELLARESVRPDDDGRNRERLAYSADGRSIAGTAGPFPEEPAVLDIGGLEGLASQAHAHYAMASEGLTADPWALWTDPEHFAVASVVPGGPLTFGPAMAREHFLLALLAAGWNGADASRLSLAYLGHALHYVQDASDPLHTVQVGAPCVLASALTGFAWRALATAGGYAGDLRPFTAVASDIVSNYHLWVEATWDARVGVPPARAVDDGAPAVLLAMALGLARAASDAVRPDGPRLYSDACDAAAGDLASYGYKLEDGEFDPAAHRGEDAALQRVAGIGDRSVKVAVESSAAMVRAYASLLGWSRTPEGRQAVVRALLSERLGALSDREARQEAFRQDRPEGVAPAAAAVRYPLFLLAEVGLLALGVVLPALLIGRRRRRPPQGPSGS